MIHRKPTKRTLFGINYLERVQDIRLIIQFEEKGRNTEKTIRNIRRNSVMKLYRIQTATYNLVKIMINPQLFTDSNIHVNNEYFCERGIE